MQKENPKETLVKELKKENQKLRKKIQEYKSLEEKFMAQLIFEKAKKRLLGWITIGGILIFFATFVGGASTYGYMKDYLRKQIESVPAMAEEGFNRMIQEEVKRQFTREASRLKNQLLGSIKSNDALIELPSEKGIISKEEVIDKYTGEK